MANPKIADRTHCNNGHEFNARNSRMRADGQGRVCVICKRKTSKDRYEKILSDPEALKRKQQQNRINYLKRKARLAGVEYIPETYPEDEDIAASIPHYLLLNQKQKQADDDLQRARDHFGIPECEKPGGAQKWVDDFDEPNPPATPEYAASLCAGCPLIKQCDAWALTIKPYQGVFGGKSWSNGKVVVR